MVRCKHKKDRGFTLVEVLISLAFLVIGILGIAGLQKATMDGNKLANRITLAVTMAEDKIEELKRLGFSDTQLTDTEGVTSDIDTHIDQEPTLFTNPDHSNDSPLSEVQRVWNVADNVPASGLKTVTVIVGWQDNRWHYITLSTIIGQL